MATIQEQEDLIARLKFTPRTYRISLWGYGGETVMGTVSRKIYDYFKYRRLDLADYAWNYDYADDHNIPEEFQPFPPGSWYECDDIAHTNGVARDGGTLQIDDELGNTVIQESLEAFDGGENSLEWCCDDEAWIDGQPNGTVVFIGKSNEKGTFFEADLPLTEPFDVTKLQLTYDDVDGDELITQVIYNGEEIDNWGGSTDGKSSDFGFYIAGSRRDGRWESYRNLDDIEYELTPWFPARCPPYRTGVYQVETKDKYRYQALWTGTNWVNTYTEEENYNNPDQQIAVKQWQGLTRDPDL